MKKFIIAMLVLMSTSAFASQGSSSSTKMETPSSQGDEISQGFRVSIVKSFMNYKISTKNDSDSGDAKQSYGIALGYASIHAMEFGFKGDIQYDSYTDNSTVGFARIEGNATYGFEKIGYAFGGLNVSQNVSGWSGVSKSPGLGIQLGVGANVTRNIGLDLDYVLERNSASGNGGTAEVALSGLELKLHATF